MTVTGRDVLHLAALAGLRLSQGDLERLSAEIGGVLEHIGVLEEVGADGLGGVEVPPEGPSPMDRSTLPSPDGLLHPVSSLAPAWRDGFFMVPPLPGLHPAPERDRG